MKLFFRINKQIMKVFDMIMFIASGLVCGMIVVGAFMRYILHMDFYGSEELILLAAFWMYYIGSAVATYEDSHISADLIRSSLKSKKARAIQKLLVHIISLFLFGVLTIWSYNFVAWSLEKGATTSVYKFPMVFSQTSLLFSFALSTVYTLVHVIQSIQIVLQLIKYPQEQPEKEGEQ